MRTPEGIPWRQREHSLKGVIPRALSILRSKGFYLPCVWESHGGSDLWGEMYTLSQCHKNFYDAYKGSCGNIMAEWLKGQALKTFLLGL